jgi:nucleotide-binding universal stress UspA family protein
MLYGNGLERTSMTKRVMKKILLAFDGTNFSKGAFEFARQMNERSAVLTVGVFLPQVDYANLWTYAKGVGETMFTSVPEKETAKAIQKNIEKFESQCRKNDMEYRVHKDSLDFAMPALRKETRFADLLIIGSESFYENFEIDEPSESLKDALHHSECPIVVVPEKFEFPETNILTYDGSTDSVYAIRQFVYLFPELCRNETLLVYASQEDNQEFPDESYIEELTARHYPNLTLMKLQLNPRKYFNSWIEDHRSAIVISGSFSRSGFSQIFKKSFITKVIRDHKIPVFIAHL